MSFTRGKQSGWAAFALKQKRKQGLAPEIFDDPFPPAASRLTSLDSCRNLTKDNIHAVKSFSSVLVPTLDYPKLHTENKDVNRVRGGSSSRPQNNKVVEENNLDLAFKKLKETYSWADDCLIEDIVAFTDNDIEKASDLLRGMVSTSSSEKSEQINNVALNSSSYGVNSILENSVKDGPGEFSDLSTSGTKDISVDASDMHLIMQHLRSLPIEPEWEEDDVYLSHRKEALRTMRSASQHSRAATNSFMRGDHYSSQQHSQRAREEWIASEKLNAKAAKEILSIRNSKNDMWKLDLHGLHAAEAVQAVQEHLQKIETQVKANHSLSPVRGREKTGMAQTSSYNCLNMENSDKQWMTITQRPTSTQRSSSLQVITGIGNHSRGQAALPAAVKSFLNENRYRYDETRPGVITVRPKFRHR